MARGARLVLIEGLPGSGKTTAAARICARFEQRQIPALWTREEAGDHPVFPPGLRAAHREPDFASRCLDAWAQFVEQPDDRVRVLDGCAFSAPVRFMYEERVDRAEIDRYWRAFEALVAPVSPVLLYLWHPDPACLIREHTIPTRGIDWYDKAADYVARTPAGRRYRHLGVGGFVEFWVRYGALCDELIAQTRLPVERLPAAGQTMRDVLLPQ
ncbi:MAG: hypothetical protein ACT4OX_11875 [Actinomycetota bacterium]